MKERYFKLYDELPPPIAERAKRCYDASYQSRFGCVSDNTAILAVHNGFSWDSTPEGFDFWYSVENAATGRDQYPSTKHLPRPVGLTGNR